MVEPEAMFEFAVLLVGLTPFLVGLYALALIRRSDDHGSDDPPPPPDPNPPRPVLPPSPRPRLAHAPRPATDRRAVASTRVHGPSHRVHF